MKRYINILFLLLCMIICNIPNKSLAQCDTAVISTDPNAPYNPTRPDLKNYFDWTYDRNVDVYAPDGGYWDSEDVPYSFHLPFYKDLSYMQHVNYYSIAHPNNYTPDSLDMHPEDGWELIHRHFGYELDEMTIIPQHSRLRHAPYFILYNKYTGVFRTFAAFALGHNQSVETTIRMRESSPYSLSALLGHYGPISQPLDSFSTSSQISKLSPYGGNMEWTVADFTVAYDPCVCNYDSRIDIVFKTLDIADVEMEGRFIATSKQYDGNPSKALLNGEDFLMAVKKDNFTVNGGMRTYRNIDSLVYKYKSPPGLSSLEKKALDLFGKALKSGAKSADKEINKFINTRAGIVVDHWVDNNPTLHQLLIDHDVKKGSTTLGLGLKYGLAAAGADFLISAITPKKPAIPNVSFIEGEMVLTGTVTTVTPAHNYDIYLFNPGSITTDTIADWRYYPSYNEPLGLFAVLETPKVKAYTFECSAIECSDELGPLTEEEATQFQLSELKYVFNPATKVNEEKTKIHIAFALESDTTVEQIGDFHLMPTTKNPAPQWHQYVTDFVSLDCAQNIGAEWQILKTVPVPFVPDPVYQRIIPSYRNLRLKIMIQYEFLPNKYGKVNSSIQTLTYPIEELPLDYPLFDPAYPPEADSYEDVRIEKFIEYPPFMSFDTATNFTSNQTFVARDQIVISADLTTDPGVHVIMQAAKIDVLPGVDISPRIELIANSPVTCGSPIDPVSDANVQTFCNSSNYKAKEAQARHRSTGQATTNPNGNEAELFSFDIFPNPGRNQVYYRSMIGDSYKGGMLTLRTITGNVIKTQQVAGGRQQEEIDLSKVSRGIYMVTFDAGNKQITRKLVLLE